MLFRLYLGQTDTSAILFRPIQVGLCMLACLIMSGHAHTSPQAAVSDVYRKFLALVQSVYSIEQQALLAHLPNDDDLPNLLALRQPTAPKVEPASPSSPPALLSPAAAAANRPPSLVAPVAVAHVPVAETADSIA